MVSTQCFCAGDRRRFLRAWTGISGWFSFETLLFAPDLILFGLPLASRIHGNPLLRILAGQITRTSSSEAACADRRDWPNCPRADV